VRACPERPSGTRAEKRRHDRPDTKSELRWCLQSARGALLCKLDSLPEYDVRRPLTPTGTNLLGLVKHASYVEPGYLADSFGRPYGLALLWLGDAEPSSDLWVTPDESRASIIDGYRRAWTSLTQPLMSFRSTLSARCRGGQSRTTR
jgi:hypothetical protein